VTKDRGKSPALWARWTNSKTPLQLQPLVVANDLRLICNDGAAQIRHARFPNNISEWRAIGINLQIKRRQKLNLIEEANVKLIEIGRNGVLARANRTNQSRNSLFRRRRVLRNEIYARRGRVFKDPEIVFHPADLYQPNRFQKTNSFWNEGKNLWLSGEVEQNAISKFLEVEGW